MSRVLESLLTDHDVRLVLLAAAICAFGAISTLNVSARTTSSHRRLLWLVLLSVCAGATTWATHFIAMLAYMQGVPMTYGPGLTTMSFVSGVVIMGLGFGVAIRGRQRAATRLLGGAVVGTGVVVLHYIGMAAVRMPGELTYAPVLVATSVVLSLGFGAPFVAVTFQPERRPYARTGGAVLMALMILSLHFTAMGAVVVDQGVAAGGSAGGVTRTVLAAAVAAASLSVLLIGMAGAVIDQKVSVRLATEADRFRTLSEGAFEGLIVHRDGVILDANAAARRMLGSGDREGQPSFAGLSQLLLEATQHPPPDEEGAVEVELEREDGSRFPAEICRRRIRLTDGGEGELCAIRDLTTRKEAEAQIAHLALHDTLTDLPNRRFFRELAQKMVSQAKRTGKPFAVLTLDLDDFKHVNDTYGHAAGDELIRVIGERISASLRDSDVSARFGGDEFAILQTGGPQPAQALIVAERVMEALQAPVPLEYGEASVTVSVGIALYPADGETVEELLRNADTALYRAKADGKATCHFFEPGMDAALVARRKLERRLRRAIAENELTVAYQPIVEAHGRAPLSFEALVRWPDKELGMVMPADFIPVAEETGLIVPIGDFVVRQACMDAMAWPSHLRVAVNLSAVQFRRQGVVETVRAALEESGLPGHRLELEVTETLLVDNRDEALRQLTELKELGVRISMDDFGTGYSALSYLQCFPFDKIKIDRIFVIDLAQNQQNASIVRAVAAMGQSLQMRVVAEGVETDREAEMLTDLDCDEIQGYLIARPMPAEAIGAFLGAYEDVQAPVSNSSSNWDSSK